MKKRVLSLLLAVACMLSLAAPVLAMTPFELYMAHRGRLPGVDYNRIKQDTRQAIKVTFQIGSQEFRGTLAKGQMLDDKTTDEIIQKAMRFNELSTAKLFSLRDDVDKAKGLREPFNADFWLETAGAFLQANNLLKTVDVYQGKLSGADYCRQYLMGMPANYVVEGSVAALGLVDAPAFIVTGLIGVGDRAIDEFIYKEKFDAVKAKALDAAIKLDQFYYDCNNLLSKEADKRGARWKLTANATQKEERTLFGAKVTQIWKFNCDLEREADGGDLSAFNGNYVGVMTVDIAHDMRNFDSEFLWTVANNVPPLPEVNARTPWNNFYDNYTTPSSLTKSLAAANLRLFIPPNTASAKQGGLLGSISLGEFETKSEFWSYHPLMIVPQGIITYLDDNGMYQGIPYTDGQASSELLLAGQMPDGLCPQICSVGNNVFNWTTVHAPIVGDVTVNMNQQGASGGVLVMNTDIFRDLQSGKINLRAGWKEDQG